MVVTASEVCQKLSLGFQTKGIKTISFRSPEHTENDIDELAAAAENQFIIVCNISRDCLEELTSKTNRAFSL